MVEQTNRLGSYPMSIRASTMWRIDPKLLSFTLARHKFVAKMFSGFPRVLEVGCGDAFASRLLHPEVKEIHSIDFDPVFINDARKRLEPGWPVTLAVHDILKNAATASSKSCPRSNLLPNPLPLDEFSTAWARPPPEYSWTRMFRGTKPFRHHARPCRFFRRA